MLIKLVLITLLEHLLSFTIIRSSTWLGRKFLIWFICTIMMIIVLIEQLQTRIILTKVHIWVLSYSATQQLRYILYSLLECVVQFIHRFSLKCYNLWVFYNDFFNTGLRLLNTNIQPWGSQDNIYIRCNWFYCFWALYINCSNW